MTGTVAIGGYDPVAYWEDGRATQGSAEFAYEWSGKQWRFTSAEHLTAFRADPLRYAPEFDGLCAFGMSLGRVAEGSPRLFLVRNGRLFLQSNRLVSLLFRVMPGRVAAADRHWADREGSS